MSSREIAEEMGIVPETVGTTDNMSESESLASGSGHSRTKNPEEPVRYRDLGTAGGGFWLCGKRTYNPPVIANYAHRFSATRSP